MKNPIIQSKHASRMPAVCPALRGHREPMARKPPELCAPGGWWGQRGQRGDKPLQCPGLRLEGGP